MVMSPVVAAALLLAALAVYQVRAAWAPLTTHGRRGGWHGDEAQNRDEH